ncbi:hypothetical protein PS395_00785 [Limosilactobacillus pontis]|uniref:hypothetical protein n=1 Tax=Limosilactobacillus pontis TaxID=35787 RepID=UPI002F26C9A1
MKRNIYLIWSGVETLIVGIFITFRHHFMRDDPNDLIIHVIRHLGDTDWTILLIVIGVIAVGIGLTGFNRWHLQSIAIILLGALWFAYFAVFFIQDIHFGSRFHLSTLMTGLIFISILVEARYGGRYK